MDTYYLQELNQIDHSRYQEEGFANRNEYLDDLRDQYGADKVNALLTVLPPSEDFDGLVTELQDSQF